MLVFMKFLIENPPYMMFFFQKKSLLSFQEAFYNVRICNYLVFFLVLFATFLATTVPAFFTTLANFDFWFDALFL